MTVEVETITAGPFAGNDIADEFAFEFKIVTEDQITVYETDDEGVTTTLTLTTDYTVTGVGDDEGGTVTRVDGPLPTGYTWYMRTNYLPEQATSFTSQSAFFASLHEAAFDYLTYLVLQLYDRVARAVRFPDSYSGDASVELPMPDAGKALIWNEDEDALINGTVDVAAESAAAIAAAAAAEASETAAAASEAAAAASAAAALTSENNAETAETNAETAETNAETAAAIAVAAASAASTSATNAATAETNAETAETNAEAAAAAAAASETAAGVSETAAAASAAAAATAETNAETAETNAETAATDAASAVVGAATKWNFSTTTTMADPGSGNLRFNHATPTSVTAMAIDDLNAGGADVSAFVVSWDDSTSTDKGTLTVKQGDSFAQYRVTGLTDNSGWTELAVAYINHSGSFTNAVGLYAGFSRTGNLGTTYTGGNLSSAMNEARATVASHATTADIWSALGNQIDWTGTATTTAFPAAAQAGSRRELICAAACSFTAGANMLIDGVSSGKTITCAANDVVIVRAITTTQFRLTHFRYSNSGEARAVVASHATTADIWGAGGNQIDWTGTATTTAFPAAPIAGLKRELVCVGACAFTAGANMLIDGVTSGNTVTCAANDIVTVRAVTTTQFKLSRQKYDGTAQVAASSGLIYIVTVTASNSTSADIDNAMSAYDRYVIKCEGVKFATTGQTINARLKVGGSYQTADYGYIEQSNIASNTTFNATRNAGSAAAIVLSQAGSNSAESVADFDIEISKPADTATYKKIQAKDSIQIATVVGGIDAEGAYVASTAALTGVRVYASSGNITGTFRLYAYTNS